MCVVYIRKNLSSYIFLISYSNYKVVDYSILNPRVNLFSSFLFSSLNVYLFQFFKTVYFFLLHCHSITVCVDFQSIGPLGNLYIYVFFLGGGSPVCRIFVWKWSKNRRESWVFSYIFN